MNLQSTHLHYDISELLLHLLLGALEPLPKVIANTAPLEQGRAGSLGGADLDNAVDVLNGAAQECSTQNTVGDLRRLLLALFWFEMEEREVDVSL